MMNSAARENRQLGMLRGLGGRKPSLAMSFAALSIFVCLLATILVIVDLMHARSVALEVARREAQNLTRSLAQQASDTFDAANGALRTLAVRVEQDGTGPAALGGIHETMAALIATMPRIDSLVIADERGRVLVNDFSAPGMQVSSIGDRSYFRYHRRQRGSGLFISEAMPSTTDATAIFATRRLDHADGSFAGVVVATIDVHSFEHAFDGVDVGRSGTISLVADDGTLLVRRPRVSAGGDLHPVGIVSAQYANFMAASYVSASPVDGLRRLFAFERLARYPLSIVVGLAEAEYLAAWRADALANYTALAFGTAVIGTLASGLGVQMARRKRAEDALALLPLDVLTGLANRRRFDSELEREWRSAAQERMPLGLLIVEVGNLKAYNDRYGHEEGDDLLISIARTIANLVSPSDLAARYSGLELAVILPATDEAAVRMVTERFRTAIRGLVARLTRGRDAMVSVTFGAASLMPDKSAEPSLIVGAAFVALQGAKHEGQAEAVALLPDALTGLADRRRFDADIAREWQRAAQDQIPLALLVVEVENLKEYNDRYGHAAGDTMLISIGRSISTIVSPSHLAARYSGLEFAAILPGTDEPAALHVAERVRHAIHALVAQRIGPPAEVAMVTVCIGAASMIPHKSDDFSTLVGAAFIALHRNKARV